MRCYIALYVEIIDHAVQWRAYIRDIESLLILHAMRTTMVIVASSDLVILLKTSPGHWSLVSAWSARWRYSDQLKMAEMNRKQLSDILLRY